MTPTPLFARVAPNLLFFAALLLAAGCASDDGRPPRGAGKHREHFPTMAGQETFFKGSITAEVLVGAMTGFDQESGPGGGGPGGGGGGGGHHRGGGGGMRMKMTGGMHDGAPVGLGGAPGGGGGDGDDPGRATAMATQRAERNGSPPVMIHLRFVNNGAAKADLVIADFLSPLGNFVVQPEKFSLEPGASLEVEPMTSRLAGDPSGGEISLSLKVGGETETKTIPLALKPDAAPPVPSDPAK